MTYSLKLTLSQMGLIMFGMSIMMHNSWFFAISCIVFIVSKGWQDLILETLASLIVELVEKKIKEAGDDNE